jgi:hypothetical protein
MARETEHFFMWFWPNRKAKQVPSGRLLVPVGGRRILGKGIEAVNIVEILRTVYVRETIPGKGGKETKENEEA